jgi:hypothetical protein
MIRRVIALVILRDLVKIPIRHRVCTPQSRKQLGLKIVPTKSPVQVMIIDHIELPSEN